MGSHFVLQPNGLLARFSDIIDNFTHVNLSREEAVQVFLDSCRLEAEKVVERGVKDELPYTLGKYGDGTARWTDALRRIESVHGKAEAERAKVRKR